MKFFLSAFACLAALTVTGADLTKQRKLEHSLDFIQGPLLTAMFDYQNQGYKHFAKSLTPNLNELTMLRGKIHALPAEEFEKQETELAKQVDEMMHEFHTVIRDPSPNEKLKSIALFYVQIELFENAQPTHQKSTDHIKITQLVKDIVADENTLATSASSILTPDALALKQEIAKKYAELEKILKTTIAFSNVPSASQFQSFVSQTEKRIEGLKFSPDSIIEALFWTDVLNEYKIMSYSLAKMLPIDSLEKVEKYSKDAAVFYKTHEAIKQFDFTGEH